MPHTRRIAIAIEIERPEPHHQDIYCGIQRFAREHRDWQWVIDEHPCLDPRSRPHSAQYAGVIARASVALQRRLKRKDIPLVNVHYQTHQPGLAGVYADPKHVGRMSFEHLSNRGFARIYVLYDLSNKFALHASQAMKRHAEQADVPCTIIEIKEGEHTVQENWRRLEKTIFTCLDEMKTPAGVVVENPEFARLFIQFAQDRGLHIPGDIAILCHDDLDAIVSVPPQISAIDCNFEQVGYEAARLLTRMMEGHAAPDRPVFVPMRGVVGRESTDYFAVQDELVANALRYISPRLHTKLSVEGIAYALNASPRQIQKRFSETMGRGISDEIRRLRLEKAKRLLAEPDRLIGSIPNAVGFATADVMNKIFKRELGITPSAYRNQLQAGNKDEKPGIDTGGPPCRTAPVSGKDRRSRS